MDRRGGRCWYIVVIRFVSDSCLEKRDRRGLYFLRFTPIFGAKETSRKNLGLAETQECGRQAG